MESLFNAERVTRWIQNQQSECWPRDLFVLEKGAQQFTGWPITVKMD